MQSKQCFIADKLPSIGFELTPCMRCCCVYRLSYESIQWQSDFRLLFRLEWRREVFCNQIFYFEFLFKKIYIQIKLSGPLIISITVKSRQIVGQLLNNWHSIIPGSWDDWNRQPGFRCNGVHVRQFSRWAAAYPRCLAVCVLETLMTFAVSDDKWTKHLV